MVVPSFGAVSIDRIHFPLRGLNRLLWPTLYAWENAIAIACLRLRTRGPFLDVACRVRVLYSWSVLRNLRAPLLTRAIENLPYARLRNFCAGAADPPRTFTTRLRDAGDSPSSAPIRSIRSQAASDIFSDGFGTV